MTQAMGLAAVQDVIAAKHPDLPIELTAQVHYIRPDEVAHVDVYGCDDAVTRRSIRADAVRLLQQLGIRVELVGSHDVYTLAPDYSDPAAVMEYRRQLDVPDGLELITTTDDQAYLLQCSETGAYVDPQRLSATLRARVDAQVLRQRPIVDGREHYYIADVMAELDER